MDEKFKQILKKISPTLKRITYRLNYHLGFLNEEDLFQEALIYLWQSFQEGKLQDKTDSYILQGCYFHLKNHLRKIKLRTRMVSLEEAFDEDSLKLKDKLLLQDEKSQNFFETLNSKFLAETIMNNGLKEKEKFILTLCSQGLTTRQIGQRLGVSHVRVVKLMGCIRKKCQRYLD